jgi:hypothetical protein
MKPVDGRLCAIGVLLHENMGKYGTLLTELNKCDNELRINNYEEGLCQGRPGLMPPEHYIM